MKIKELKKVLKENITELKQYIDSGYDELVSHDIKIEIETYEYILNLMEE